MTPIINNKMLSYRRKTALQGRRVATGGIGGPCPLPPKFPPKFLQLLILDCISSVYSHV